MMMASIISHDDGLHHHGPRGAPLGAGGGRQQQVLIFESFVCGIYIERCIIIWMNVDGYTGG